MKSLPNPNAGKFVMPDGYKMIGWQVTTEHNPAFKACVDKGHNKDGKWREFDNSLYLWRCTDVVTICDECKQVWHTDMSD